MKTTNIFTQKQIYDQVHSHVGQLTESFEFAREVSSDLTHVQSALTSANRQLAEHPARTSTTMKTYLFLTVSTQDSLKLLETTNQQRIHLQATVQKNETLCEVISIIHAVS